MKQVILDNISYIFKWFGLHKIFENKFAKNAITIVNYHNPNPESFASHIRYFSKRYSFISLDQMLCALEKKNFKSLPLRPMLITFDDGFKDNAKLFPIIKKYRVPAVIYAVAGVINTKRHFWFKKLKPGGTEITRLRNISDTERRQYLKEKYDHWDEKKYSTQMALSVDDLKEFMAIGGTVGSHTVFHPLLDTCSEEIVYYECYHSRKLLERFLQTSIDHFALPGGQFNEQVIHMVKKVGYKTCRTTQPGWVRPDISPFSLPNFGITDNASLTKAIMQASGVWYYFKKIKKFKIKASKNNL